MKTFNRSAREPKRPVKEKAAESKPLSVMKDAVFKAMLTMDTDDSREALKSLLSACVRREVSAAQVVNNDAVVAHLGAKALRLDVNVVFNDGEAANLEMQVGKTDDDLRNRATLSATMLLAAQSRKGRPYREIKRVYQIFFLNCNLYPHSDKLPRRYSFFEEEEHDRLTEMVEIILYEMPKLERKMRDYLAGKTGPETLSEEEKWCIYMKYRHIKRAQPLIRELCRKEEGIMHAERTLIKIDRDYINYIGKMNILKNEMDLAQRIYNIEQKAQTKEKLKIARKMKNAGHPLSEIAEFTDLSNETIGRL
jgi:predicted transposase/invertase (TIGR01784 family)